MTILSILTIGVIPLVKTAVKRQREQQLREALREMREAIKEFKRDTVGAPCCPLTNVTGPPVIDPRSRVMISDNTIFTVDNIDFYPPDLDTLTKGVNIVPRPATTGGGGGGGVGVVGPVVSTKKKTYLRKVPIDPMTGKDDWCLVSSYNPESCDGGENVFEVRSRSEEEALNGEKYSDW